MGEYGFGKNQIYISISAVLKVQFMGASGVWKLQAS